MTTGVKYPVIPEGVEIKVSGNPSRLPKKRSSTVFGPLLSSKRYIIHNSDVPNVVRGLIERVFRIRDSAGTLKLVPSPTRDYDQVLLPETNLLLAHPKVHPLSLSGVLPLWHGSKLKVYTTAYESLLAKPLAREDGHLKTFVKCEKISKDKVDPAPRVIQPRSARYNLSLARFIKPNEHNFYKRIDQMFDTDNLGDKTVFKGLNARQAAEHMILKSSRYSTPVYIGLDASRFDQHVSREALIWEHEFYLQAFSYGHDELRKLLHWQRNNIGRAYLPDGKIKYKVSGRRASGDMNTSLGNCLIMSSLVHAYCREQNIAKFSLANNGDDCVVVVEKRDLKKLALIPTWFKDMGFTMKVEEPVFSLEQVDFCQMKVVRGAAGYNICVRNPNTVLSKDLHSTHNFQHDEYMEYLSSVGDCGRNSTYGVPILQAFYAAMPRLEIKDKSILNSMAENQYKMRGGAIETPITSQMRHSFWKAFGYTPDAQIELERMLSRVDYTATLGPVDATPYASLLQPEN